MKAIIFDAFGTLFRVTNGGSAKTIMKNITDCGMGNHNEQDYTMGDLRELLDLL